MLPQFIYYIHSSSLCTPIQMSYFWGLSPTHCHRESCLLIFHCWQLHLCFIVQLGIWAWSSWNTYAHTHTKVCKIFAPISPQNFKIYFTPLFFPCSTLNASPSLLPLSTFSARAYRPRRSKPHHVEHCANAKKCSKELYVLKNKACWVGQANEPFG